MTVASIPFTLLNTRPAHQADALSKRVQSLQGQVINCPTIEIQWLNKDHAVQISLEQFKEIDKVIFTSANAVQGFIKSPLYLHYKMLTKAPELSIELYAIGRATQQSGLENQLPLKTLSKTNFDSEHLLAHSVMQSLKGQSIAIVKGQGGRTFLSNTLQERGANVILWDVYRRVSAPFCAKAWQRFVQSTVPILLITSVESFESLMSSLVESHSIYADLNGAAWLFLQETIVFSERIKNHMLEKGWCSPICVVEKQSNEGVLQAIEGCVSRV